LEEGRERRFTPGFSTTKMMRMKDIKMKKRLKSSSKSWTPATETFLWQVFSFLSVVLPILGLIILYMVNYEKPLKKPGCVCSKGMGKMLNVYLNILGSQIHH